MRKPIFNRDFLENWRAIDPARWESIAEDILETFFRTTEPMYRQLLSARDEGDWDLARQLVHALKSSFGLIGGEEAHRMLQTIEILLASGKRRRAEAFLIRFDLVYRETLGRATDFRRTLRPSLRQAA